MERAEQQTGSACLPVLTWIPGPITVGMARGSSAPRQTRLRQTDRQRCEPIGVRGSRWCLDRASFFPEVNQES